jgi:glycine/D-amino acid oxidase-like deaminating enzyme
VILATGPWIKQLADGRHRDQLSVTRQVVYWFEAENLEAFAVDRVPFIMWIADRDEDYIAIFPSPPGTTRAVKVMGEQFLETCDPETVRREVTQAEIDDFYDVHLATKVSGITRNCVRAAVCLYTNTADDHFLIDSDPGSERITVMSPCSGHGFKHSTALAEAAVERIATGESTLDLSPFYSP